MDPLSVAASVAGVTTMGVQLSQTIYNLISTFYEAEREMSTIANDLSLLAMVLNELEGILRRDSRVYRRRMVRVVNDILNNCEGVFESISKYVVASPQDMRSSKQFQRKVRWYFQQHRVRPLQAGLESMKSTLNVLLHVVHLARVTEAAESFVPSPGMVFTHSDVQNERRILVEVVLDNRRSILSLKKIEEDRDKEHHLRNAILEHQEIEGADSDPGSDDRAPVLEPNTRSREEMISRGLNSFGDWRGGSSANTGPITSLFSKAAKDSATSMTYSNTRSVGSNKNKQKGKITITEHDTKTSSLFAEKQGDEAEGSNVGSDDDWGAFTTATTSTRKKHKERSNDPVDGGSNFTNPTIMDKSLENTEAAANDSWRGWSVASSKGKKREDKEQRHEEMENEIRKSRDVSPYPSLSASTASHHEYVRKVSEISEAGSTSRGPESLNGRPKLGHTNGTYDPPSPLGSHANSLSQSPASVYYSMSPEFPITDEIKLQRSEEVNPGIGQYTASAKGLATNNGKSQELPASERTRIVTPTAQWFLSVVPHEPSVTALIVRPHSGEAEHLRGRAEETAKQLLLKWTNIDPDVVSGEDHSGDWSSNLNPNSLQDGSAKDPRICNQPYQMPYTPQAYPAYTPQQWYPPPVLTASPPPNQTQTDSEELARLKKLILDEKAEQDIRAAAPPATPSAPQFTEEVPEDTMHHENAYMEAVNPMGTRQEFDALGNEKHPKPQPVIMRDWLGRRFIFPVDMCQTWEGLHKLIQEAFGHMLQYRPMVEKSNYLISHESGVFILPSTWESFVQPGLEIKMEIPNLMETDRDESGGEELVGCSKDNDAPETLIPPLAPEVPRVGSPLTLRSKSDDEPVIDDLAGYETDNSFPDGISYIEGSDPRYLSIEKVLLEQRKVKAEAEMKLERNRRFFQLKQQLVDQGAAIQARQDAADQAEQDTKLAWLEKQVRDQKEELDRLPPLMMTPPSSSADDSLSKSASSPQRKPSLRARLLGRVSSRSVRSKDSIRSQQLITEG